MADQIEIRIPKTVIQEETGFTVTADFRTRATKAASTPTTVHYRVDDLESNTEILGWTSVSAASQVTIDIPSTVNKIKQGYKPRERKQIIVQADRGLSTQATNKRQWYVENLTGIT